LSAEAIDYPSPLTFNYLFSFGAITGLFLSIQILTGVLLAMHYVANSTLAFESVEHIMANVNNG